MTPNSRTPRTLRIGQLARASSLSPDTLRHYERIGLLPRPPRSSGGFREYPAEAGHRVRVIQRSLAIGFTLAELAGIFRERSAGRHPCQQVRALAGEKLQALEAQIAELKALRRVLRRTLVEWDARLAGATAERAAGLLESLTLAADAPAGGIRGRMPPRRVRAR